MAENKPAHAALLEDYKYEPLDDRQMRLVHLYPTRRDGLMYCTIEHVSIDDNPSFEALSYTWGTSAEQFHIQVGVSVLSIGENLAMALRTLSSMDKLRIIWVDAICIDQSNASERNHQVRFMKDIYTRASSVLIWLGEAADGSDALLDYLDTLDASSALTEHRAWIGYDENQSWDKRVSFQQPPVPQESVDALLCRPWFGRVWIQQEAAVNVHTKVQCGSKVVTWDQLFSLVWEYQRLSGEGFAKDQFSIDALWSSVLITLIQSYRYPDRSTLLLNILRDCTYAGATDPRDRIFGVQNLARDPDLNKLLLEPDYNNDVLVVYTELAKRYLTTQGPFILGWAGRNNQCFHELPSWAPDWTIKNIELPSVIYKAAGDTESICIIKERVGKSILLTNGIIISSIAHLGKEAAMPPYHGLLDNSNLLLKLRKCIQECISLRDDSMKGSVGNANSGDIWRALAVDSTRSWTRLGSTYAIDLVKFSDWLAESDDVVSSDTPDAFLEYLEILNIRGIFIYRRFAIDSKGNMCIVPFSAEQNDKIVVISGLSIPLVIREKVAGEFEIIGECYLHGYMDGEALNGDGRTKFTQLVFI
jgi:hypothetical protein